MVTSAPGTGLADVCDDLDAVLVPRGSAAAQLGVHATRGQAIWCCGQGAFSPRYPGLLSEADDDGRCIDVVVDFALSADRDGSPWTIGDVRLDGRGVDELLREVGEPTAVASAAALRGAPTSTAAGPLADVLVALLRAGWPPEDRP